LCENFAEPKTGLKLVRTSVEIDETLMKSAMRLTGLPTKSAAIERGLQLLVKEHTRAQAIIDTSGIGWEGDLSALRTRDTGPREPTQQN
jgi:Arc/MetJ family transcription regulator